MRVMKACAAVAAVVLLPFVFQANTGCGLDVTGICADPCIQSDSKSNPNSYLCSCTCDSPNIFLGQFPVLLGADDAEQKVSDNSVDVVSTDIDFSSARLVGIRFQNLNIPPGATIGSAFIQFAATSAGSGAVTLRIKAQKDVNAPVFSAVANNISSRPLTTKSADWNPPNWPAGEHGPNELTPNLKDVLQEVVSLPGWAEGKPVVFVIGQVTGTGARHAASADLPLSADLKAMLMVDYQTGPTSVGPQDLQVCELATQNPNLNGGVGPDENTLKTDCQMRVANTLTGLAEACGYPSNCSCTFKSGSQKFADKCNSACVENKVEADCSDFDPVDGKVQATNAPGDTPVCLANSPMSQGLYGRRTRCLITKGSATVKVDDDSPDDPPGVTGILQFLGTPCPGGGCAVGLEYLLDIGAVKFSNFFGSETFNQLAGLGKNNAGDEADLSMMGDGTFMAGSTDVSARGHREGGDQLALFTNNNSDIHINVLFGSMSPTCALKGTLLGGSVDPEAKRCAGGPHANKICTSDDDCDDDDCEDDECVCVKAQDANLELGLDLTGTIQNQPPTADAGDDQTIECTDTGGTPVTLDGSGSSDLDNNIVLYSWRKGSRVGPEVGTDAVTMLAQTLGSETYVLRVIDAFAQTDEDSTMVHITDTTKPVVRCAVAKHVLENVSHNLVNVGLAASAQDQCEGKLPITVKVFGDEDDQTNTGDGVFSPDAKNLGVGSLRLRAERQNSGNGRVYLIVTEASDSSDNRSFDCCTVIVPKNPRLQASLQSAETQAVAAQNFCLSHDGAAPGGFFVIGDGPVIGTKQ